MRARRCWLVTVHDVVHDAHSVADVGRATGEQRVDQRSDLVHVGQHVRVAELLWFELLGRGVGDRESLHRAGVFRERAGEPPVGDLRHVPGVARRGSKQHVRRFDVEVGDPVVVGEFDPATDTLADPQGFVQCQPVGAVEALCEVAPVHVLHRDPGQALAGVDHADDVLGVRPPALLALAAVDQLPGAGLFQERLDHVTGQRSGVCGLLESDPIGRLVVRDGRLVDECLSTGVERGLRGVDRPVIEVSTRRTRDRRAVGNPRISHWPGVGQRATSSLATTATVVYSSPSADTTPSCVATYTVPSATAGDPSMRLPAR